MLYILQLRKFEIFRLKYNSEIVVNNFTMCLVLLFRPK